MCSISPPPPPNSCFYSPEQPPQGTIFPLSPLRICPACRGGCGAERVLNKFPQPPDVSVHPQPDPPVTWCGCRGSLAYVCASHRIPLPAWSVSPALWLSCAVCLIWDHGPWFLRGLRNIQPHPPIVKGGFASVRPGMFPAFTRQQSLDMCLIVSKTALDRVFKRFIQKLEKHAETSDSSPPPPILLFTPETNAPKWSSSRN